MEEEKKAERHARPSLRLLSQISRPLHSQLILPQLTKARPPRFRTGTIRFAARPLFDTQNTKHHSRPNVSTQDPKRTPLSRSSVYSSHLALHGKQRVIQLSTNLETAKERQHLVSTSVESRERRGEQTHVVLKLNVRHAPKRLITVNAKLLR